MKNLLLILLSCSFIAACGVKPGSVDGDPAHPHTYPDMRTDPLPRGGPAATMPR